MFPRKNTIFLKIAILLIMLLGGAFSPVYSVEAEQATAYLSLDSSSNLVLHEFGGNTDDQLTIRFDGNDISIGSTNSARLDVDGIAGTRQDENGTLTIPVSAITGPQIIINGGGGNDTLTIDLGSNANPFPKQIVFNGQGQNPSSIGDTLVLTGTGLFNEAIFGFINEHDGTINVAGHASITYTGLEPISSTITAADVTLNYSSAAETITVTDATGGQTTVDSTVGEIVTFVNPTNSLTINAGAGADTINLNSLAASYPAHIVIAGEGGPDVINITAQVSTNGRDITLSAESVGTTGTMAAGAGSILLTTDMIAIGNAISGAGMLTIEPQTTGTSIGLGGGPGTLNLDDTQLARLSDGFSLITVGKSDAGNINLDTVVFNDPLVFQTGGDIADANDSGTDLTSSGNTITFDGRVTPGSLLGVFTVNGDAVLADNSTLAIDLTGTPGGGTHDQLSVSGSVTIGNNVTLNLNTSGYTVASGSIPIVDNDLSENVMGTFSGLAEGAQTNNGGSPNFLISYAGGDGNDVVLVAASPTDVTVGSFNAISNVGLPIWFMPLLIGTAFLFLFFVVRDQTSKIT